MYKLVNLTQYDVNIVLPSGKTMNVPTSGIVASCSRCEEMMGYIEADGEDIPAFYYEVKDLPDPQEEIIYIVNSEVRAARSWRGDLLAPGPLVRNDAGQPIGYRGLMVF